MRSHRRQVSYSVQDAAADGSRLVAQSQSQYAAGPYLISDSEKRLVLLALGVMT